MESQKISGLHYLLSENKHSQLIKIMIYKSTCKSLFEQYNKFNKHSHFQQNHSFVNCIDHFNIEQLIEIKGSQKHTPKYYQNTLLIQMIKRKLKVQRVSRQTRLKIWLQFTDIYVMQDLYNGLNLLPLPTHFSTIISQDINRTQATSKVKQQASQVLRNFSKYNPYIGYCQGLNYIVAFLLETGFQKQQSFFILKRITQCILSTDYYVTTASALSDVRILYDLIGNLYPQIRQKLKYLMADINGTYIIILSFAIQWFITLFTKSNLSLDIKYIIWDHLMVEGNVVLLKSSLVIIDLLSNQIKQANTFCNLLFYLEQYLKIVETQTINIQTQKFIQKYHEIYLNNELLNLVRIDIVQKHKKNQQKIPNKEITSKNTQKKKCNRNWTICVNLEQEKDQTKNGQFFVFRKNTKLQFINEYVQNYSNQYFDIKLRYSCQSDKLMIGRIEHICNQAEDNSIERTSQNSKNSSQSRRKLIRTDTRYRNQILQKLQKAYKLDKKTFQRSQSILFMKNMIQNISFRNLVQIYNQQDIE